MLGLKHCLFLRVLGCSVFALGSLSAAKDRSPNVDLEPGSTRETRIVGGSVANPNEWPFIAVIADAGLTDLFEAQFCGGSLIHPRFVLTAAHCVEDVEPQDIQVVLGVSDLRDSDYDTYGVIDIIIHPEWDYFTNDADVALLVLDRPAQGYATISLVAEESGLDTPGTTASVAGWGRLSDGGDFSDVLLEVDVPILDQTTANSPISYDGEVLARMFAAGFMSGGRDSCQGDSGGPLVVPDGVGGTVLAGVVSWGEGCALPNFPGVYARVSSFRDWVLAQTRPDYQAWESNNGLIAEYIDTDGDGWNDGGEYAFGTDFADATKFPRSLPLIRELIPEDPLLTIEFPERESSHLDYVVESWDGLSDWVPLEEAIYGVDPLGAAAPGFTQVAYRSPETLESSDRQFMRVRASVSEAYPTSVASISPGQNRRSALLVDDETNALRAGRYKKDFFVSVDAPVSHRIGLYSTDFDAYLMILSTDGSTLLAEDDDGGSSTHSSLIFAASADYVIRVTSSDPNEIGRFSLGMVDTSERQIVFPGQSLAGTLTVTDPFDPIYLADGNFHKQDFLLIAPANGASLQVDMESSDIDSYLIAIDPRTGDVIDENDDIAELILDSQLLLDYFGSNEIMLRVTSAIDEEVGDFTLTVTEF